MYVFVGKAARNTASCLTYRDKEGSLQTISCDNVIISGGMKALKDEAMSYYGSAKEFYAAGDCTGPEDVMKATRTAFAAAVKL